MKVALDVSKMHKLSQIRGIGVYAQNLYDSLKKYTDIDVKLIEEKTNYNNFDLIHYPFFDLFQRSLLLNNPKPFIITIPDLIPLQFPNHYPTGIKAKINNFFQKKALKNAKAIIAISETVKKDITSILKLNSDKVFAVHLAPSEIYIQIKDKKELENIKEKYKLPEEFVLYVGNVNWNKNILNIAKGCIDSGKQLVIIGGAFLDKNNINHPEKQSHKEFIEKYENNGLIKLLGFVENEDMVKIMNLATVMLFASYYEGFGLPILEAQACGLPVITSKGSATEEIAGDSALLVNPQKPEDITGAIKKVFNSGDLQKKLTQRGFENIKRFSWKKTAHETAQVYKNVLT